MSTNQQEQKDPNLQNGLSVFNSQVIRTIFLHSEQKFPSESIERRESVSTKSLSPRIDLQLTRRTSSPTLGKLVGSNRFFVSPKK